MPQPWVGQLANAGANASGNATDALTEYITLSNNKGMTVVVLPLGAIIQRLIVPDK
jgi:galactose mutarotase-like enzyme